MAGGVFSEAQLFGMTIRESATDGSDFTNPAADYRRLFLGEDGLLHVKDSSGTVSDPYSASGSGISSGTSNPGSPSDGDLFYRTDKDLMIRYRSTGTRWVCTCPHIAPLQNQTALVPQGATASRYAGVDTGGSRDLWVERVALATVIPSGTSNSSNYYTLTVFSVAVDTKTDGNAATRHDITVGALLAAGSPYVEMTVVKTSAPGSLYVFDGGIVYRYIVT